MTIIKIKIIVKSKKRVINELWDNFLYLKEIESKDVKNPDKNATKS